MKRSNCSLADNFADWLVHKDSTAASWMGPEHINTHVWSGDHLKPAQDSWKFVGCNKWGPLNPHRLSKDIAGENDTSGLKCSSFLPSEMSEWNGCRWKTYVYFLNIETLQTESSTVTSTNSFPDFRLGHLQAPKPAQSRAKRKLPLNLLVCTPIFAITDRMAAIKWPTLTSAQIIFPPSTLKRYFCN